MKIETEIRMKTEYLIKSFQGNFGHVTNRNRGLEAIFNIRINEAIDVGPMGIYRKKKWEDLKPGELDFRLPVQLFKWNDKEYPSSPWTKDYFVGHLSSFDVYFYFLDAAIVPIIYKQLDDILILDKEGVIDLEASSDRFREIVDKQYENYKPLKVENEK